MRLPASIRLGTKVNLFLLAFLILLGAATSALLYAGFRSTQANATDTTRQGLEDQGRDSLLQLAAANSAIGQLITSQAVLMGANASRYMIDLKATGVAPAFDGGGLVLNEVGYAFDPNPARRTDVLVPPRVAVDERVLRDLRDSAGLDAIFPALLANNRDAVAVYYVGDSGLTRYFPVVGLQSKSRDGLPDIAGDVRSQLGPAANPDRAPVWTAPYRDEGGQGRVVTAYTPVYEGDEYRGVIGVDLSLARLLAQADRTGITPGSYAFVTDRNGDLLPSEAVAVVRTEAANRENEEFAETLAAMRDGQIGVDRVIINGEAMFVGYAPLGDFGGSLALAVPIDELTAQAQAVTSSIDQQGDETIIFMLGMMAVFFIGALAVSTWLGRRVVLGPIERLVSATRSVAAGDLDAKIPVQSEDELGLLADSFNFMTSELASSRQRLEDRNVLLEEEVAERRRAEGQLREERDFNEAIVGSGGALIMVMDAKGRIVRFNAGCERASGYTSDEVSGQPAWSVLSPENERRGIAEMFSRIAESEFPNRNDSQWQTKDGRRRYISWSNSVIRDARGTARYYVSTGIDRTEQRQSEEELREREQQYRDVFESTTDGMFITDLDDRIVDANPAAQRMHGYTLDELRALEPFALLHPRSLARAEEYLQTLGGGRGFHTRARSLRKDGSSFISEVLGSPITYQGKPHILAVTRDISEQVTAERLLREREEQYRSVYENASDALIITSFDGQIVDVNPAGAAMHGYTREEFLTLHPTQFIHPDDHHVFAAYLEAVADGRDYRARARDIRKDGSEFHVEVLGTQITYQGTPHVLGVVRDVTAQVLTEQVLEHRVVERTRELTTLLDVSRNVASTIELRPLLRLILEQLRTVVRFERASILMVKEGALEVLEAIEQPNQVGMRFDLNATNLFAQQIGSMQCIIINDPHGDSPQALQFREIIAPAFDRGLERVTAWMAVPIALKDRVVGMLALTREHEGAYTEQDSQLALAIATQAAVAIENARLFEEAGNRTRELGTMLEVSRNVGSKIELGPLLELVLDQVRMVADYDRAAVFVGEGDDFIVKATRDYGSASGYRGQMRVGMRAKLRLGPLVGGAGLHDPVIVDDVKADTPVARAYASLDDPLIDVSAIPAGSTLAIPLVFQERVVGGISLSRDEVGFYTPEHARLARAIASQVAVAIENARLYEDAEARTSELAALLDVSHSVASTLELKPMVGLLLDRMQSLIEYDGASVLTLESDALRMLDSRRPGYVGYEDDVAMLTIPVQRTGSIWQRLRRNEPVTIADVHGDEALAADYRGMIGDAIDTTFAGVRSWLAVPLAVKERTIGTLTLSHKMPGHFKDEHVRLARAVADQAAVGIENARLYGRAQELAAVEERQRLARELHDSVSQALYGIALGARTARTLLDRDPERAKDPVEYVMSLAEAGLAEMRALIFELRPESLELEGLVVALDKQAAAMRARHNVRVDTTLCDEPDIPLEVKQTISRIAQEALHNVVKHARATSVALTLECTDEEVMFEVRDDGSGFDPVGDFAGHLGLRSMRERAASLGGRVEIESTPGAGSKIRLTIPTNA